MKNTQVEKTCEVCGKPYKVKLYKSSTSKYCSKSCWSDRGATVTSTCPICGIVYKRYRSTVTKTCSKKCSFIWRAKYLVGDKSPAWKGGKSLVTERARAGGGVAKWRIAVYKRDNYTCQKCGSKKYLNAHHIKHVSTNPELITDIDNGITLCIDCHGKEHGKNFRIKTLYPKQCDECGKPTTGRSLLCHSCSAKRDWKKRKAQSINLISSSGKA